MMTYGGLTREGGASRDEPTISEITLPRTSGSELRFTGRLIGLSSIKLRDRRRWNIVSIFADVRGAYVLGLHHAGIKGPVTDERAIVERIPSARAVFDSLLIHGGLDEPGWNALRDAARNDTSFAEGVGDRHLRACARLSIGVLEEPFAESARTMTFSGIMLARTSRAVGDDVRVMHRVYRMAPTTGERRYLHTVTTVDYRINPARGCTYTVMQPAKIIAALDAAAETRPVLAEAVARDSELAATARGFATTKRLGISWSRYRVERENDPLDATMARSALNGMPPSWDGSYRERVADK